MQQNNRIPRWLVESDPSWEKSVNSDIGMLRWVKKGTQMQAVCSPTSMFCEIVSQDEGNAETAGLSGIVDKMHNMNKSTNPSLSSGSSDITKYLTSRYLNPGINGPRFDLRKFQRS